LEEAISAWQAGGALQLVEITRQLEQEDYALDARHALSAVDAELKALGYDAAAHDAVRQAELAGRESQEQVRRLDVATANLESLKREIDRLERQASENAREAAKLEAEYETARVKYEADFSQELDMEAEEQYLSMLREQENQARDEVGGARNKVEVLTQVRERKAILTVRRSEVAGRIGLLKQLEKAFGKDGVPALLIEQALPDLEEQANIVLDQLSNGTMSVRFITQRDYKDKKREDKQETLDICISDSAGEREYEMFSGGEAFRVNFAIRLALSRLLAQRAGARLQTLVIDEGFGSQDSDGRQRLIEAINYVRQDFKCILVITHLEELKDAFPSRIEVEKTPGGSRVRVVSA
jgi:exonuclease SbcC